MSKSQCGVDQKTIEQTEFYDFSESMSLSYVLLCNSLVLNGIEPIFGMEFFGTTGRLATCLAAMVAQFQWQHCETLITSLS